jgi:hypothetical protein
MNEKPTLDEHSDAALRIVREDRNAYENRPIAPRAEENDTVKQPEAPKPEKKYSMTKKGIATVAGLGIAAGAGLGLAGKEAYGNLSEKLEPETVAEGTAYVDTTLINAVNETVAFLVAEGGIDETAIPYDSIVYESQGAQSEYLATIGGEYVQPGTPFEVEIMKNGFDVYSVDVSPIFLESPDVPETSTGN